MKINYCRKSKGYLKQVLDLILSLLGLVLSLPAWSVFALAILLSNGRPVFYVQERVGKGCRIFKSLKFRSMIRSAEDGIGPCQAKENDVRITRIGALLRATAMDELPQLINILNGDMSFVGPRALRPVEIDNADGKLRSVLEIDGFKERSSIRPGLTGIAQILTPKDIPRAEKFKYDIWYVKNHTFLMDMEIIFLSFLLTFAGRWEKREHRFKGFAERWSINIS